MKLTFRPGRRMTAALAIACAALMVPAVALASSSGPGSPAALLRCHPSSIYTWFALSPNGAAGTIYYPVEFTNIGTISCTLRGYPNVWALSGTHQLVGPAAAHSGGAVHTVILKPGQTAHASLGIANAGFISCTAAKGAALKVQLPLQAAQQIANNFNFPACTNKVFMYILPIQSGIGVP